jgi:hypothetical protein
MNGTSFQFQTGAYTSLLNSFPTLFESPKFALIFFFMDFVNSIGFIFVHHIFQKISGYAS